jgi:O-antigen ligase
MVYFRQTLLSTPPKPIGWKPAGGTRIAGPANVRRDLQTETEFANPIRKLAFYTAIVYVFLRFSMLHELVTYSLGFNTYILYLVGPPAFLGVLLTGGLRRAFRLRTAYFWLALTVWLFVDIPFSSWRGGSVDTVSGFVKLQLPILFVMAGLPMTWKETRTMILAISLAGLVSLLSGRFFMQYDMEGRLSLTTGTISNANDFAAHLLLLLPFVLFVSLLPSKPKVFRIACLLVLPYGLYLILSTASRGAEVAMAVAFLFVLWRATPTARIITILAVPILAVALFVALPQSVLNRLKTFSTSSEQLSGSAAEAAESADSRNYLFNRSLEFTFEHPIFGVGPGQFSSFEGKTSRDAGLHGVWQQPHSIFTQISSECGIPAFLFFVCALVSTFRTLLRVQTQALRYQLHEISRAAFCVLLGMSGFLTAAAFLNLGYLFYLPALGGLAIAMHAATQDEIAKLGTKPSPASPSISRATASFRPLVSSRPARFV